MKLEPEITKYEFSNYRYFLVLYWRLAHPIQGLYASMAYEGMEAAGQENIVNSLRCA